jgi:hypothetical protein
MWNRPGVRAAVVILSVVVVGLVLRNQVKVYYNRQAGRAAALAEEQRKTEEDRRTAPIREALFNELQPVPLANCTFERFGEARDGGYLLCSNLLKNVEAGYSYGISGYDGWGCDVSTRQKVPVHQYDCFNTAVPVCKTGRTIFHPECVGGVARTEDGRPFDTVIGQLQKNGDAARHVVMKMDVEGAEWESLPALTDEALQRIDQLVMELHGVKEQKYVDVVKRLKQFFHVAHLHINNYSCEPGHEPFGGWAYEVLFVNKKLTGIDPSRKEVGEVPAIAKNNPLGPDCQGRTIRK